MIANNDVSDIFPPDFQTMIVSDCRSWFGKMIVSDQRSRKKIKGNLIDSKANSSTGSSALA